MSLGWKLLGVAVALAAAYFLVTMYGNARYKAGHADEAVLWTDKLVAAEKSKLTAYQAGVSSVLNADKQYIETVKEKVVPVTKTIVERAAQYAQTSDGAGICLSAERVSVLEQTTGSLFDAPTTSTPVGATASLLTDAVGEER